MKAENNVSIPKRKDGMHMNTMNTFTGILAAQGYVRSINALKDILITIGTSIGAVMIVYGALRFAISFKNFDHGQETNAVYSIVAGGLLLALSALVTALT